MKLLCADEEINAEENFQAPGIVQQKEAPERNEEPERKETVVALRREEGSKQRETTDTPKQKEKPEQEPEGGSDGVHININIINLILFFLKNDGIVFGDNADLENVDFTKVEKQEKRSDDIPVGTECVLKDEDSLSQWLAAHYNDFEMAFLIALAVFEELPCSWVYEITEELFQIMGGGETADQNRIRIPHRQRIKIVGAQEYKYYIYNHTGRVEEDFIRFQRQEYAARVLKCVWKEFRFFRETLFFWLEKYIAKTNYTKSVKAIRALANLLEHDFPYFESRLLRPLLKKEDLMTDFAVAQILSQAHENPQYRGNIENLFSYWTGMRKLRWSVLSLMMCVNDWPEPKIRLAIETYIDETLKEREAGYGAGYVGCLPVCYAIGHRKAVYFRIMAEVLYDRLQQYSSRKDREKQNHVGYIFLDLITVDFNESDIDVNREDKHKDMVFVKLCVMNNETALKAQALWKYIWKNRKMRSQTKSFLEKYLFRFGGCNEQYARTLRRFLFSFQDTSEERADMEFFLQRISLRSRLPVRVAEKIDKGAYEHGQ